MASLRYLASSVRDSRNNSARLGEDLGENIAHVGVISCKAAATPPSWYGPARLFLSEVLCVKPASVSISKDFLGRPVVAHGRHSCFLSVSHSRRLLVFAVSKRCAVGLDVETCEPLLDSGPLANYALSQEEYRAISLLRPEAWGSFLLEVWVRKEACLKALGIGLRVSPKSVSVVSEHGFHRSVHPTYSDCVVDVQRVPLLGAHLALASIEPVKVRTWNIGTRGASIIVSNKRLGRADGCRCPYGVVT